ncbi:PLDc N-terminal domain-containing protein [Cellulomonas phragmiteti]|uniref:Cardiolipin synthase N-terminal domain-containing protein n=1 Tax=Cellulomonas phragmiteti TaxID=478780 RepID=A0ABQ4DHS1_9CELL|nr:PLDc N-terminal domain-containing protein [Cellulomonas phragmiteti]GIG38900.1 hypothetical protein Cph01nite_06620 [Cellulomonas phragmiteti]
MLRYLPLVLVVAFTVYCVFDVLGSDERTRRGLPAPVWLLVVLALPVLGGVVWLVVSRGTPRTGTAGPRSRGPVAPDDDPEFLFRLEQEQRRRARQEGTPEQGSRDDTAEGPGTADAPDGKPSA